MSEALGEERSNDARARFIAAVREALAAGTLQRLSLARYHGPEAGLERVLMRPLELRGQRCLQQVWRHATRDITLNPTEAEVLAALEIQLSERGDFGSAHAATDTATYELQLKFKGGRDRSRLHITRTATTTSSTREHTREHNREKHRPLSLQSPHWTDLGVTHRPHPGAAAELVPAMGRKWKQINRFAEIVLDALAASPLADAVAHPTVRVVDFGSGKGYLTFALHELLASQGRRPEVIGVELRRELVDLCNGAAQQCELDGLSFDAGDVRHYTPEAIDVVVALHACDIATDFALHLGLRAGASIILSAPCCHKELRPQLLTPSPLRPLLRHGIHLGQEAEMLTDSLRALLLEASGYDTQVFEFIALEHTQKNKMILAVRRPASADSPAESRRRAEAWQQVEALKTFYGIRAQSLETLLKASH
jgi:SAM-dependent methyltransferase